MEQAETLIRLDGVGRRFGAAAVLGGVSLAASRGQMLCIMGESGCGKTTLLNIIGGLDTAYTGSALVCGVEPKGLGDRALSEFRRRTVGFVFQHFNLLDHLDCAENVMLPAFFSGVGHAAALSRSMELLQKVGMERLARSRPGTLSGGEKQRVAIARALFAGPVILLCDEPTGDLDSATAASVLDIFDDLRRGGDLTVVVATHDGNTAARADKVLVMKDGSVGGGGAP